MDYKLIAFNLVAAVKDMCEAHMNNEEALGGIENIKDNYLVGQLIGQQAVLLAMTELINKLIPNEAEGFYQPPQEHLN